MIFPHELPADDEGLGQSLGLRLHRVANGNPEPAAIAEQALEATDVLRSRDEEDVADAREHEGGERVVDHGLVVDGQELLAHRPRDGIEASARATGENDAFGADKGRHRALRIAKIRHFFFMRTPYAGNTPRPPLGQREGQP